MNCACPGSVLDGSKIEVVLSKPVDRETYQYVKSAKAAAAQVTYLDNNHCFAAFLSPSAADSSINSIIIITIVIIRIIIVFF